jgi:hypothetical protein
MPHASFNDPALHFTMLFFLGFHNTHSALEVSASPLQHPIDLAATMDANQQYKSVYERYPGLTGRCLQKKVFEDFAALSDEL